MVLKVDVPPALVRGGADEGYGPVADAFWRNFTERGGIGAACAIYRDGRKVVDLWGGYRDGITRTPWREDTMVVMFSTTKGVASLALAHSGGLLDYDERVAAYWPQFAWRGKGQLTVRQLLSHQAGLPVIDIPLTAITGELGLNAATLEALVRPAQLPSGGLVGGGLVDVLLKTPVVCSLGDTKPTADLPFSSAANAAFATPGNGGSFGMADPDTGIGYCYAPNRLGFGRIGQRELALRDTLYRDVLGERPQRPTQRQPPPEAPAGDFQPATPRRSDPEHPPLGAPGKFTRAIPVRREDSEMATVNAFTDHNLNGQGFECLSQEAKARYALPLRFTPAVGTILLVIGLILQSPIWLGSLAVVALSGVLFPRHMVIDLIYNLGVRHLFRAPPLPPTPKPRRFSYLISTSSLAGAALSFYYGLPVLGFILGGVVVIGATILAITLWCLGSWIYRIIFVPAAAKLGWNPM